MTTYGALTPETESLSPPGDIQRLATIVKMTSHAVILTDVHRRITWVNEGFTRISGYTLDEVRGKSPGSMLQCKDTDQSTILAIRAALDGCLPYRGRILNESKHGRRYWLDLEIQPERAPDGELVGYLAVESDVTELVHAKQQAERVNQDIAAYRSATEEHALVSVADRSGRIIDVNKGFCRISGYSESELLGQDHRILNSGHHPSSFWADMWRTVATGNTWRAEVCNRAKDGSIYWVDSTIVPVLGKNGKPERYVSIRFDITEREQARREATANAKHLDAQFAAIDRSQARMDISPEGTILDVNQNLVNILLYPREELVGMHHSALLPIAQRRSVESGEMWAQLEQGKFVSGEFERVTKDGSRCWIQATYNPVSDEEGTIEKIVLYAQDITASRRLELELSRLREARDRAIEGSSDGLWDYYPQGGHVWFSKRFKELLRCGDDKTPQSFEWFQSRLHPEDFDTLMSAIDHHLMDRKPCDVEIRVRCRDGEYGWFRIRGKAEWDPIGTPVRMSGSLSDISRQKTAEHELRAAMKELAAATERATQMAAMAKQASQAKSEFLANMSHEIRTPMTAILGYTELLMDSLSELPTHWHPALESINRNGKHLLSVINDILDVSKIESGKFTIEQIPVSPKEVVQEVLMLLRERARSKGLAFEFSPGNIDDLIILSDPTRLRQILLNLVGNAIKFTERGRITIETHSADGKIEFSVSDTGVGMSPKQADEIRRFENFIQADTSTSRKYGGTGLGLKISNALAQMLGGGIELESTLGTGSTFKVTVSAIQAHDRGSASNSLPTAAQAPLESTTEIDLANLRLLLADDSPDNQRLVTFLLNKIGIQQIDVVDNGEQAFEKASRAFRDDEAYDVILMDMQMPLVDGYTATKRLRDIGYRHPIIALTAHAMESDREKCIRVGCDGYATKPIDRQSLKKTLLELTKQRGIRPA